MIAFIAAGWAAFTDNPVTRKIAAITGAVLLAFIGYHVWKGQVEKGVRRQAREEEERRNQRERERMLAAQEEVADALEEKIEQARDDVDALPEFASADELRARDPSLAALVFGSRNGDSQ
jgi:cell division protein FtsB